jgi:hypothetical protein
MRIRQVKPEFWSDSDMAELPYAVRLIYIGLWCVADDAGYIDWRPERIAHDLLGYESRALRERHLTEWSKALADSGHLQMFECGCALIPTLSKHQRVTGKQNFRNRDAHGKHLLLTDKHPIAPGMGMERNVYGTERNVDGTVGPIASDQEPTDFRRKVAAAQA